MLSTVGTSHQNSFFTPRAFFDAGVGVALGHSTKTSVVAFVCIVDRIECCFCVVTMAKKGSAKLPLGNDKKMAIQEWCWENCGKGYDIFHFHHQTKGKYRQYNGTSVANIFCHAKEALDSGKMPKMLTAKESGKQQGEAAELSNGLAVKVMKMGREGAMLKRGKCINLRWH